MEIDLNFIAVNSVLKANSIFEIDKFNLNQTMTGPIDLNAMLAGTNKDIEFDTPEMCIPAFLKL